MTKSFQPRVGRLPEVPWPNRIDCVYLTCFRSEFSVLAIILHYSGIGMHRAETLDEADFLLTVTGGTVLLSDVTFLDGSWHDALLMARRMHPLVGSLVVADPVDGPSLMDVYELGACGSLWKPVDASRAIHLIHTLHEAVRDRVTVLRDDSAGTALPGRPSAHCR